MILYVKNSHLLGFIKTKKLNECLKTISKFVIKTLFSVGFSSGMYEYLTTDN